MNNTLKYALGAVLSLGFVAGALAQENFPDVPENHWAFEALARMKKDGLLVGYPDGLFRGGRPATRYELAVAIHATYVYLRNLLEDHEARIKKLESAGGGGAPIDNSWKAAVDSLRNDINGMKGWGDSINDLKRMAGTFEKELAAQGVDIDAMKKDLATLSSRVDKLEKNKMPVTISGDINLYMRAGSSSSNRPGVGVDGSRIGTQNGNFAPVGFSQDFSMFHEALLKLAGTNEEGPKWWASILVGNMLNGAGGSNEIGTGWGRNVNDAGNTDIVVRNLVVDFDTALLGQGFNAKVGRLGYKISPYLYQMPDMTPYYDGFFDDGDWTMDGGVFGFNFGAAKFNVFAGRNSTRNSSTGAGIGTATVGSGGPAYIVGGVRPQGLPGGAMLVDQTLGLHLNVPLTEKGGLDLAYLFHEANVRGLGGANRAQVYGGELNWDFGVIDFNAGYAKSNIYNGKASIAGHNNKNNDAWHVNAGMENDKFGVMVGYREIKPLFNSMGDWGRIGMWWNPTDIKGVDASVKVNLTEALTLNAKGGFYSGMGNTAGSLRTNDRVTNIVADLNYQLATGWDLTLGTEMVDWNIAGLGKPRERWYNIGLGYSLSDMAKLSILWQISDYDGKSTVGFNPFPAPFAGTKATGNLLTTQFSVKF